MGSLQQPLQPGMVLRFGSLELMSLDVSYDMVLLPPWRDDNDGLRLARWWRALGQHLSTAEEERSGRPRHPPRRRRRRRGNHDHVGGGTLSAVALERVDDTGTPPGDMSGIVLAPETTAGVTSPRRLSPKQTDDASTLAKDLLGVTLVLEMTVCSTPDATSPPSIDQEVPSVFHPVPFRFSFDPPSDPATLSAFVKAYPNLPGYHMWSTWDRLTAVSIFGSTGSEEEDDPDSGWDFSGLNDLGAIRDFMFACDHCLSGCSDDGHDLDDEGDDPSRECFHVDQGDHNEGNHLGMLEVDDPPGPTSRVDILRELAVVLVPTEGQDIQLEQIHEMQARVDRGSRPACAAPTEHRTGVGRPSTRRRSLSSGPRHPAPHRRQCQGSAAPGRQRVRPEPRCSGDATSSHAGAVHHQGTAYLGRTQGSPGRRRGSTSRELRVLQAS
jgi:hypothetical protein